MTRRETDRQTDRDREIDTDRDTDKDREHVFTGEEWGRSNLGILTLLMYYILGPFCYMVCAYEGVFVLKSLVTIYVQPFRLIWSAVCVCMHVTVRVLLCMYDCVHRCVCGGGGSGCISVWMCVSVCRRGSMDVGVTGCYLCVLYMNSVNVYHTIYFPAHFYNL